MGGGITMATPDRLERIAAANAVVPGSSQDPFYHSTGQYKDVTLPDGRVVRALDVGSTKPPAALEVGMVSPASGLTITGTERNMAKEREAMNIGYTKEYIASRGGINSQGYFNDTPLSGQLTAAEYKTVTKPDGTIDTPAMARILQEKQIAELISQGLTSEEAYKRVTSQYGKYGISYTPQGGYDANGNKVEGGQYDATGKYVGGSSSSGGSTAEDNISQERRDAFALVEQTMRSYGFSDTELTEILNYIKQGLVNPRLGTNQLLLDLRNLNAYKTRFAGNEARRKAGLNVLSEAQYLQQEKDYSETFRQKGLQRFSSRGQFATLIGNDISNVELGNRVDLAVDRVQYGDPLVLNQLRTYYGITDTDIAAYYLNPKEVLPELEARTTSAEIGAVAAGLGLESEKARAERLRAAGVTLASARTGYQQIASILPRAEELTQFYAPSGIEYTQTTAEEETFKGTASAKRARERLKQLEIGSFSGSSGVGRLSNKGIAGTF